MPSSGVLQTLGSSAFVPEVRKDLLGQQRCRRVFAGAGEESSFFIPNLGVGLTLMELLVLLGGGMHTAFIPSQWPIFHRMLEGYRERKTTKPLGPD